MGKKNLFFFEKKFFFNVLFFPSKKSCLFFFFFSVPRNLDHNCFTISRDISKNNCFEPSQEAPISNLFFFFFFFSFFLFLPKQPPPQKKSNTQKEAGGRQHRPIGEEGWCNSDTVAFSGLSCTRSTASAGDARHLSNSHKQSRTKTCNISSCIAMRPTIFQALANFLSNTNRKLKTGHHDCTSPPWKTSEIAKFETVVGFFAGSAPLEIRAGAGAPCTLSASMGETTTNSSAYFGSIAGHFGPSVNSSGQGTRIIDNDCNNRAKGQNVITIVIWIIILWPEELKSRVILAYMCVKLQMRSYVCHRVGPFWVHFGSILGPFWVHFGSILGPFWVHFGSTLGPLWVHFGSILGPFWVHFGSILGPFWVHFGSILGPFWVHFGSILGPFWVHFGSILLIV